MYFQWNLTCFKKEVRKKPWAKSQSNNNNNN